ncbi:MAG TPA: hypothetical protein VNH18_32660 [Bryobacteraceae bacterium]|nr:hypothetical protein [Bryobacteraceae bacterium]
MDITLGFTDDEINVLQAAMVSRGAKELPAFVRSYCQRALDEGVAALQALAVAQFQASGVIPVVLIVERVDGALVPVDETDATAAIEKLTAIK